MTRRKVVPFSRDYRRRIKLDMGLPPRRSTALSRRPIPVKVFALLMISGLLGLGIYSNLYVGTPNAGSKQCRVTSVIDGDTVRIWCPARGGETARLLGFDTPEVFSPKCFSELRQGRQATRALKKLIRAADEVTIVREGTDQYGRGLARLFADGQPVSAAMIAEGHARPYGGGQRKGWCA